MGNSIAFIMGIIADRPHYFVFLLAFIVGSDNIHFIAVIAGFFKFIAIIMGFWVALNSGLIGCRPYRTVFRVALIVGFRSGNKVSY
jgi:hypothetical protein